jgi:regulator of PEP synthase PpsR (kinase-PPPase family)
MASNESKQRWNTAHYKQVKVAVDPELAAEFKNACAAAEVSMASVLSEFMASYSGRPATQKSTDDPYATRKRRRDAVNAMIAALTELTYAEERYRDNIPANLQNSSRYEDAEQSISAAYDTIELLGEIY